ncbi:kelch domain-containing protein 4-like [Ruditapes philippinarum]|uniref:kelch domain-containing protein 4-like n=1 Tax=Ruditapes philippinarum TaxID=129788 RepID=UPI00295C1DF4|nr:kelch domain-containing protein 4-like [Ruditapes philippinarum]
MGKKNKKEKKGQGKEKTKQKAEKNAKKRVKKELAEIGEDDIEKMIKEFQEQDKKKTQVIEEKCLPPSPRCNLSFTAHPDRDELIMFGGEYFTGNKMYMYNDLLIYNIKKNEWLKISAPNCPPPRSSHQAVALRQGGGQLWIFGGEFASPTQSQFYHYKDLWLFHLKEKKWEKVSAPGGPSARSGHRMVQCKKQLVVFGGFHDNIRDYKYFNDAYAFNLDTYTWTALVTSGIPPAPRSGCVLAPALDQGRIIVYGGYSKERIKKDVDAGKVHTDMFALMPEGKVKEGTQPTKWKWVNVKQSGSRPSPRSGLSLATVSNNRAVCFGGVFDEEDNDDELKGKFYNTLYFLELDKGKWFEGEMRGKKLTEKKKRRRKKDEDSAGAGVDDVDDNDETDDDDDDDDNSDDNEQEMDVADTDIEKMSINFETDDNNKSSETNGGAKPDMDIDSASGSTQGASSVTMETESENTMETEESVFKLTVGPQSSLSDETCDKVKTTEPVNVFTPSARMNTLLVVKNGLLFLYGGIYEVGDKQYTLSDMYSLDINKMEEWTILIESDLKNQVWEESDSSSDEDDMEGGAKCAKRKPSDSDESDDDDDDDEIDIDFSDAPERPASEAIKDYFERTKDYWLKKAKEYCDSEDMSLSEKKLEKLAKEMCQESFS